MLDSCEKSRDSSKGGAIEPVLTELLARWNTLQRVGNSCSRANAQGEWVNQTSVSGGASGKQIVQVLNQFRRVHLRRE
jgi:hypothetical protein